MIAPLTSGKCQLNSLVIALAVTLPILMSIVPHEASRRHQLSSCSKGFSTERPTDRTFGRGMWREAA